MDMNMMQQQMRQHLDGMSFPANKQDVMNWAMQHGASDDEMEMVKKMPMDNFNSMDDIMRGAGPMPGMG
jgi:Protein of unknown function (DUF2795)